MSLKETNIKKKIKFKILSALLSLPVLTFGDYEQEFPSQIKRKSSSSNLLFIIYFQILSKIIKKTGRKQTGLLLILGIRSCSFESGLPDKIWINFTRSDLLIIL